MRCAIAINFPVSLDAFTNPVASDALNAVTVPHATQHANANDAIEALETKLGIGSSTPVTNSVLAGTSAGVSGWTASPTLTNLTLTNSLNMSSKPITNIGAAGTDFSATGGLTLADALVVTAASSHALSVNGASDGSVLRLIGGTITAAYRLIDAALTWNNGGTGFQAIVVNVTDTASAAASQFLSLQVGSVEKFSVRKDGLVSAANKLYPGTDAAAAQTACGLYAGTGAPNNANGANGDIYFRSDGGALTTVYQRRAGAWVGII